ncbi:hypothetical protein G9A89_003078 [Geosiphon pyriformis]|nr:hypothetical protein G9A89_003078 [Geosiphon pyriformis]
MADSKFSLSQVSEIASEKPGRSQVPSHDHGNSPGGGELVPTKTSPPIPITDTPNSQEWHIEWDTKMDIALFNAVMKSRPVGVHKHFHMIHIARDYNANSPVKCTIQQLWERLSYFFDLEALDEMEFDYVEEENDDRPIKEFSLPMEGYDQLMAEHRKSSSSYGDSPTPIVKSQKGGRKDVVESPTSTRSTASSPELEETPKKSRRTSKQLKKSDTIDTPNIKTPVKRGRGRPADPSKTSTPSSGRRTPGSRPKKSTK